MTVSGPKRVAMAPHGLILWENEAIGLKIIFKYIMGPKITLKFKIL